MAPLFNLPKHETPSPEDSPPLKKPDPQKLPQSHRYTTDHSYEHHHTTSLRKYAHDILKPGFRVERILAHDCVAIKFTAGCYGARRSVSAHLEPGQKYPSGDELIDGVALFKAFVFANKRCYWNVPLTDAISSLEYKGIIHPSTLLLSTSPRHLNVLRNAWARRILREPHGFRAEFLGDIDEIVTQPVQRGQFAPLSDSLCWAIAELTEAGTEAFIDSIQSKLTHTFPSISQPPKDLIFQTLEKLIRDQKIYQTSHGYYVVTPDVSTFINYSRSVTPAGGNYGRVFSEYANEKRPSSRYSSPWGSTPSVSHHDGVAEELRRILSSNPPNGLHLRRHNSLKIIRNSKMQFQNHHHPSMGARSLSFRLSKCNSLFESDKESDDDEEPQTLTCAQETQTTPPPKKRRSFLTRLFRFRCASKPSPAPQPTEPVPPCPQPAVQRRARSRRRSSTSSTRRSSSPSSSVSGIYASITQRENVRLRTSKSSGSMYELIGRGAGDEQWPGGKHDASDASR